MRKLGQAVIGGSLKSKGVKTPLCLYWDAFDCLLLRVQEDSSCI